MKLYYPYDKKPIITQYFAQNANTYYAEKGLQGHGAWDMTVKYGEPVYASISALCYSVINKANPDLMRYRAVYQLVEEAGIAYEVVYGHLGEIYAEEGQVLFKGQILGTESNTGDVASGGKKVTKEMKQAGSRAGSHVHFQVRLLKPVTARSARKTYLTNSKGVFKKNGFYYEVVNYDNGFKGCIDPAQFIVKEPAVGWLEKLLNILTPKKVSTTLRYGSRGEDVKLLQKALGIKADSIFGVGTEDAVKNYQHSKGLKADGIVGEQTKKALWNY